MILLMGTSEVADPKVHLVTPWAFWKTSNNPTTDTAFCSKYGA